MNATGNFPMERDPRENYSTGMNSTSPTENRKGNPLIQIRSEAEETMASEDRLVAHPTFEQISARAYALWQESGSLHDQHLDHWYAAEKELSRGAPPRSSDHLKRNHS